MRRTPRLTAAPESCGCGASPRLPSEMLDRIGQIAVAPLEPGFLDQLAEQAPGETDKRLPLRSSSSPGCSPTNITCARELPSPGTLASRVPIMGSVGRHRVPPCPAGAVRFSSTVAPGSVEFLRAWAAAKASSISQCPPLRVGQPPRCLVGHDPCAISNLLSQLSCPAGSARIACDTGA